jgi:hypothetical protein
MEVDEDEHCVIASIAMTLGQNRSVEGNLE